MYYEELQFQYLIKKFKLVAFPSSKNKKINLRTHSKEIDLAHQQDENLTQFPTLKYRHQSRAKARWMCVAIQD